MSVVWLDASGAPIPCAGCDLPPGQGARLGCVSCSDHLAAIERRHPFARETYADLPLPAGAPRDPSTLPSPYPNPYANKHGRIPA